MFILRELKAVAEIIGSSSKHMVEQQLHLPPFASVSSQRRLSSSRPHEPYRHNSYDSTYAQHSPESFSEQQNMNTWVRECSPMSTSSTISGSDDTLMPTFADPFSLPSGQYSSSSGWVYQMNMPALTGGGYTRYQPPAVGPWNSGNHTTLSFSGSAQVPCYHDSLANTPNSGPIDTHSMADHANVWKVDDTDSESDSSHDQVLSTAEVLQLGYWVSPNSHSDQPQRHFVCPSYGRLDFNGRVCDKSFKRIEHLRRHYNTVHNPQKNHHCKVPRCLKAFTRRDNLRDHYWTHINRGGRAGKNDKMSMEALMKILGPHERKLIKKLKLKLHMHQKKKHPSMIALAKF